MYFALELSKETQSKIWAVFNTFFTVPDRWNMYCNHITLIHSSHEDWITASKLLINFIGHELDFSIKRVGISDTVLAFEVDVKSVNEHSHITMCVAPDHKPVEANDIKNWERLYCAETFCGTLKLKP